MFAQTTPRKPTRSTGPSTSSNACVSYEEPFVQVYISIQTWGHVKTFYGVLRLSPGLLSFPLPKKNSVRGFTAIVFWGWAEVVNP